MLTTPPTPDILHESTMCCRQHGVRARCGDSDLGRLPFRKQTTPKIPVKVCMHDTHKPTHAQANSMVAKRTRRGTSPWAESERTLCNQQCSVEKLDPCFLDRASWKLRQDQRNETTNSQCIVAQAVEISISCLITSSTFTKSTKQSLSSALEAQHPRTQNCIA
jgi:hypothetical protein